MDNRDFKDKYVNPYTDFGFKKLFGTEINKDLCENEKGEKILVEMQRGIQQYFKDRSLYYATFPIREQGQKGEWDYQLKAVYIIGILNFTFDKDNDNYFHHEVQLLDNKTKEVFYDKLTFIYLEMPKFNKTEDELTSMFEKWLFVLRNLSRLMERPKALQERIFTKLFEAAEIAKFTKLEYDSYEESLKAYRDWKNTIDTEKKISWEEGHEKGREEGFEEGQEKKTIEMARNLKVKGIPINIIVECSGLTEEEINAL